MTRRRLAAVGLVLAGLVGDPVLLAVRLVVLAVVTRGRSYQYLRAARTGWLTDEGWPLRTPSAVGHGCP